MDSALSTCHFLSTEKKSLRLLIFSTQGIKNVSICQKSVELFVEQATGLNFKVSYLNAPWVSVQVHLH